MTLPSHLELQMLAILASDEMSGLDVARRYREKTGKTVPHGTLYTTLRRLKEKDWVNVRRDQVDSRVRYFQTTQKGQDALIRGREFHRALATFGLRGEKHLKRYEARPQDHEVSPVSPSPSDSFQPLETVHL